MPRKSKPFIDKKNATTYHLYHRSQRDTENVTGSGSVLLPSSGNYAPPSDASVMSMSVLEKELNKLGALHDDATETSDNYDYSQHMRPISGNGVYYSSDGKRNQNYATTSSLLGNQVEEGLETVEEVPRQLDSIMLSTECMDEEIAHALFDDVKDGEFEEILDDFCITANQEIDDDDNDNDDHAVKVIEFDYDKHIQGLLRKAKQEEDDDNDDDVSEIGSDDDHFENQKDFFKDAKPLNARDILNDYYSRNKQQPKVNKHIDDSVTAISYKTNQTCSSQKLEETLAEYDSDEIGSLEDECGDIQGFRNGAEFDADGQDQIVNTALDQFLQESKDDFYMRSEQQKNTTNDKEDKGGSGYKALVGTKLIPVEKLNSSGYNIHPEENIEEMLKEADDILAQPYEKPPIEDVLIDGKSYYSIKSHNPWDCETILTTYSNLDNHPTTIGRSKKKSTTKSNKPQIQLSNKTGLPIFAPQEYYDEHYDSDNDDEIVNLGARRNKKETAEEKKARKELLKEQKREKRERKQQLKVAFKEEFQKQATLLVNDDIGGKSVFRYS